MKPLGLPFEREFIEVYGSDRLRFLQGMLSADIKRASLNDLYTCDRSFLLTAKGKIVSEILFLIQANKSNEGNDSQIILSCPKGYGQKTVDALEKLIIADDVSLKLSTDLFYVYRLPEGMSAVENFSKLEPVVPAAKDIVYKVQTLSNGALILPIGILSGKDCEYWSKTPLEIQKLEMNEFNQKRIQHGVPLWGIDYNEESFLMEYPIEDAISFHKGCYIGQEVVARTTYRGHVVRASAKIRLSQSLNKTEYVVLETQPEKVVGKLTTVVGQDALGLLRIDQVSQVLVTQESKTTLEKVEFLIAV